MRMLLNIFIFLSSLVYHFVTRHFLVPPCALNDRVNLINITTTISRCLQGVIYPDSHRSLRNNCETQSEKVRIKKIKRKTVLSGVSLIANRDRS